MWKKSLTDISRRAAKKSALPQLHKAVKTIVADQRVLQTSTSSSANPFFSQSSEILCASQNDYQNQLKSSVFQSSLENGKPLLRAADDSDALLRQAEHLPFLYAQEAFCALLKAGEVELALQLVSFWHHGKTNNVKLSRRRVTKELNNTIDALENLKDSVTLRALADILSSSLKEQVFAQKKSLQTVALTHSRNNAPHVQYKLFAPLGAEATSNVLVRAVAAICRLGKKDGVSAFEKVLLVDRCTSCTLSEIIPSGTPRLPFPLYRQMEEIRVKEALNDVFLQNVCPNLVNKFVHPSHYRTIDILSLSIEEAKYIDEHWKIQDVFATSSAIPDEISHAWRRLMRRVLPQSPSLQNAEENQLLINLIAHRKQRAELSHSQAWINLRSRVITLLKSSQQSVRRFAAATLLKNKHIISSLKISPVEVGSVYAKSFYSKGCVDPALCAFCDFAVRRLCQNGRYKDAACLAWNHLSVDCPATKSLFRSSSTALNFVVLSMSRAMFDAAAEGTAQNWMGYRSLALLRLAAASSNNVTVLHCVPVCVNAISCGVPFAAVNETLSCAFRADYAQRKWAINMVRLCSPNERVVVELSPRRSDIASNFYKLLASVCGVKPNLSEKLSVHSPSRSKQLALWETITGTETNPRLNALMLATFLNGSVRDAILNCSFLLDSPHSEPGDNCERDLALTVDDIWNWEVAASIASNCTTPESFRSFLKCLKQRKPKLTAGLSTDLDKLSAVMFSELEGHDLAGVKAVAAEK